ncbi:DUF192 domain-containing protein [Candidatus Nitrospira bockiana]
MLDDRTRDHYDQLVASLFVVLACLVVLSAVPGYPSSAGPQDGLVTITLPGGGTLYAELADTAEKRARGLMFRENLPKDRAMLFTFAEAQPWSFWMKNTRMPLDIIWLDGNKRIVHIEPNVPTCSRTDDGCPQYQPNEKAMYVLELAGGMAESLKLRRGATLTFQVPGH